MRSLESKSIAASSKAGSKKPPLPFLQVKGEAASEHSHKAHPLFGDGNIPKNKDMNSFTKSIQ